jgi:presenilin-like A22 family membrane protease
MKHTVKITLFLVFIFLAAQVIGLAITNAYIDKEKTAETGEVVFENLPLGLERPEVEESTSFIWILVAVVVGTIILLLLIKFKIGILWKLWFFLAIWLTLAVAFGAFIPAIVAIVLGFLLAGWKILKPNVYVQNFTELFIYGGLAAIFVPIMNVFAAVMMLILISGYDMYAVWKSKHMIKLAKFQSKQKMFAGLLIPYKLPRGVKKKKKGKKLKEKLVRIKTAVLGGGDIGFPLIFSGVVLKELIEKGATLPFLKTLIVTLCVTIALFFLFLKGKKDKFYPAMPFISIGCLIGYGLVLLL